MPHPSSHAGVRVPARLANVACYLHARGLVVFTCAAEEDLDPDAAEGGCHAAFHGTAAELERDIGLFTQHATDLCVVGHEGEGLEEAVAKRTVAGGMDPLTGRVAVVVQVAPPKFGVEFVRQAQERLLGNGLGCAAACVVCTERPPPAMAAAEMRALGWEWFCSTANVLRGPFPTLQIAYRVVRLEDVEAPAYRLAKHGPRSFPKMLVTSPVAQALRLAEGQIVEVDPKVSPVHYAVVAAAPED